MRPEFDDRREAGERLADALLDTDRADGVVYALPRGGVPLGAIVAERLGLPLDLILVRKIGLPWQPEVALGAVVGGDPPVRVDNPSILHGAGVSEEEFTALEAKALEEIARRRKKWFGDAPPLSPKGRTAIIVDDGAATGATARAAISAMRAQGARRIVLALPIAAKDTLAELRREADEVVCLASPSPFVAVGGHYRDFRQISDDEVSEAMRRFRRGED